MWHQVVRRIQGRPSTGTGGERFYGPTAEVSGASVRIASATLLLTSSLRLTIVPPKHFRTAFMPRQHPRQHEQQIRKPVQVLQNLWTDRLNSRKRQHSALG